MKPRVCELCNGEAALHCESDSAFLCWSCDAHVHEANLLVARHVRVVVCTECRRLDPDKRIFGTVARPVSSVCRSCKSAGMSSSGSLPSSLSSFSCISSAESAADPHRSPKAECTASSESERTNREGRKMGRARGEVDAMVEGYLVNLCRRLRLEGNCAAVVGVASEALGLGIRRLTGIPLRVCAVAAVWFAVKPWMERNRRTSGGLLKRLEVCSGVPAKAIVRAESKLSRAVRRRRVEEEGWAECCK